MTKIAIFVEGQTELILVKEILLKSYGYSVTVKCIELEKSGNTRACHFNHINSSAIHYFQIVNVGNDVAVLKRILKNEKRMYNEGFERIYGLRDMYSKQYREESTTIDIGTIRRFIIGHKNEINKAQAPGRIKFCFAIMEAEAWILGLYGIFLKMDNGLTREVITQTIGQDLFIIDPEKVFFKPSTEVHLILSSAGIPYSKKEAEVIAISSRIEQDDIQELSDANKCSSFNYFFNELLNI